MGELEVRIGTSGWSYSDWVGPFYPEGSNRKEWLSLYAREFPTVEIDSTWYGTPRESTVRGWRERTPDGFVFAAKFPRDITHEAQLVGCRDETAHFLQTMGLLEDKCGPLLLQFPYGFQAEAFEDLEAFVDELPAGFRYVVEVRHRSWLETDLAELLAEHQIALCLIDHPWFPKMAEATTDFVYVRWLGNRKKIEDDFSHERYQRDDDVAWWLERLRPLASVRKVFGYVNNHYTGFGPACARRIASGLMEDTA